MGNTGLANGPQAPPGPGIPKASDGGRSATVMLPLLPHPECEASVVVATVRIVLGGGGTRDASVCEVASPRFLLPPGPLHLLLS